MEWQAGWPGGVAGRVGPGGGGVAGLMGRPQAGHPPRVGWYWPVAETENVYTARKGVCNDRVKNALGSG